MPLERIVALEQHSSIDLASLAAYIKALGGHLEVAAVFGVRRYPLDLSEEALSSIVPDVDAEEL